MSTTVPKAPTGAVPAIGVPDSQDYPRLVYTAPYFAQTPLAELIEPSVIEAAEAVLPVLVPPYVQGAADAAVDQRAVLLTGSTMSGPLYLNPAIPTQPSQAASMAYVDMLVSTGSVPEVPPVPLGQTWARQTGAWVPGLSDAPNDGTAYGRLSQAWSRVLPIAGGALTGQLTLAADPAVPLGAATMQYVDGAVNRAGGPFLPTAGGTVSGTTVFNAASFPVQITNGLLQLGGSTFGGQLRVQGAAATTRTVQFTTNNLARWNISGTNAAESGNSAGSLLEIDAYSDTGAFTGILFQAERTSGGLGLGRPDITSLAPWTQSQPRAVFGGGVVGNNQNFITAGNTQPTATLAANPLAVTNGSTTVTVTWTGCAATNGPLSRLQYEAWVNLQGVTAVGGITPSGWVKVVATPNANTFTFVWSSAATSTATGGGAAVTVQPSYTTQVNSLTSTEKTGANGFNLQTTELWNVDPFFYQPAAQGNPKYLQRWHWTCGPPDAGASGTNGWSLAGIEWDLTNRGPDNGYSPNAGNAVNPTTGIWMGATAVPSWATGGGTAANWGSVFNVYSTQEQVGVGVYNAFINQPHALVGAARDPTGHGGVAFEAFGALHNLPAASFSTTAGTSNIKIAVPGSFLTTCNVGDQLWVGNGYTISGVTFSQGLKTITALDTTNGSITFVGTGTAAASVSGGGAANVDWYALSNLVPFAPFQASGSFKHGLISNPRSRFESGGIVETQPGNGILWGDGTGVASINSLASTAGNISVLLNAAGTGTINANAPIVLPANPTTSSQASNKAYVDSRTVNVATTGSASVTGVTTETNLVALRIPGGVMGLNGTAHIHALWSYTSSTNSKTLQPRINNVAGATAGAPLASVIVNTANQTTQTVWIVRNNNSQASQAVFNGSGIVPFSNSNTIVNALTLNTANDWYVNLNGTLAVGTETITLVHAHVVVHPA